ncbi:MAG: S8 family serine peptidase, partial [Bacteroidetes bacterium]|nr:S8 family serine peptidase [Bacteroidota bacterium]
MMVLLSACKPRARRFFAHAVLPLVLALHAPAALAQEEATYKAGVVVVQFAPGVSIANKAARAGLQDFDRRTAGYGVHLIERVYPFLDHVEPTPKTRRNLLALRRMYYVRYTADILPKEVAADIVSAPGVVYAEPVLINRTQAGRGQRVDPNDPRFGDQPELRLLQLPEAWDVVRGEEGAPRVVIAVVDGGGEWRHEDLRANVWTNPGEIAGNGIDDDDNGFIDDVHGVNFANQDERNNDPTGLPETPGDALHGTASAGSASAVTDNGTGVAGAAWNAEIMHINTGCGRAESDGGICYGYEGILYAAANGADIINASWSGLAGTNDQITLSDQTLDLATDMGALVVASASNDNLNNDLFRIYPARNPRVLSVGATEKATRQRADFSNYGKLVNVFAPGVDILTTGSDNGYVYISGTSFSSPLTAGVAALVKTRFPEMTPDALREHIRLTSDNMDAENPDYAGQLGRGFVNALAAVQAPSLPAVRLKRWSWADHDSDRQIASGDAVTITATVVNYLSDARQLKLGLVGAEPYPFIEMTMGEADVGYLASGDSVEIQFEFRVTTDAPANQRVRFYTHFRDGSHEDQADMLSFRVNHSLEEVHRSLSALYTATGGDNWTHNDNWDITRVPTEEELGTWAGVGLSEGWLVELSLLNNNLTGQLPPKLGNLTQLQNLWLDLNSLIGAIPPELGNLTQLQWLGLGYNSLTGEIPPELGNLTQLQRLGLGYNSLTGEIPPELGNLTQLQWLWLDSNSLTGEIPPELSNLTLLQWLDLSGNTLTGAIPPELGNLTQLQRLNLRASSLTGAIPPDLGNLTQLQRLNLRANSLTGAIPPDLGNLTQLQFLWLDRNTLTGEIPPELGNLTQLQWLDMFDNSLTGAIPPELVNLTQLQFLRLDRNTLTGEIPPELGNLTKLQFLRLDSNSLTGAIPPELGNLTQLPTLLLFGNSLTGAIPPELGNLTQLQELDLFDNFLTGAIPPEFGNLTQLQRLDLHANSLTGAIPPELGNLAQLQWLDLHENSLTGAIPPELGNLTKLEALWLSGNSLTGAIPPELGNLTQLQWLDLLDNSLTGAILPELGNLMQLQFLRLNSNSLTGAIPPELGNLTQLQILWLSDNHLTGVLPRSFMQLDNLQSFHFDGQTLCAPSDDAFQGWLSGIPDVEGPTCDLLQFVSGADNRIFTMNRSVASLVLPEATGGATPYTYVLEPALPAGLSFDASLRTISGTPTPVTPAASYMYSVADNSGNAATLIFTVEVVSGVSFGDMIADLSFAL